MAVKRNKSNSPGNSSDSGPKDPLDTPFMRQYLELKKAYPDSILFFRMGDFYELFLEDAQEAAPIMDVTLTRRQNDIPMAGVPYLVALSLGTWMVVVLDTTGAELWDRMADVRRLGPTFRDNSSSGAR